MTQKGRAGPALVITAIGSFIAGTISLIAIMVLAPPLASFALRFGPPEYTSLLILGLLVLGYMSGGPMIKTLAMVALGLLLGMIGLDPITGYLRSTYDLPELADGIGIIPVAVGLFGLSEILTTATGQETPPQVVKPRLRDLPPSREEWRDSIGPIGRGTVLGFLIGVLPGPGHIISTFASYAVERRLSKHPERFGHGAVEGVAGPESANNAAAEGSFVPMLALGIPTNATMAIMIAALIIHGVFPGPLLLRQNPEIFWGFIASMYIGNVVLVILNIPLVSLFVNLLRVPYRILYPLIIAFCFLGVYAINGSVFEVWIMTIMGLVGYAFRKFDFEASPIVIGLVLSPMLEIALRQSLIMSWGSYTIFFKRPISACLLAGAGALLILALWTWIRKVLGWSKNLKAKKNEDDY